jgi:transposase-like protein
VRNRIETKLNRAKSLAFGPGGRIAKLLTAGQVKAARLVAEGKLSVKEIAAQCGCSVPQLMRWKRLLRFVDECQRQHRIIQGGITGGYISTQKRRLAMREQIFLGLMQVTEQRAKRARKDLKLAAQGGLTGLIVEKRQYDTLGNLIHTTYRLDHATITQLQSLMEAQARDLGQWGLQAEVNEPEVGPIPVAEVCVSLEPISELGKSEWLLEQPKMTETQAQEI